MIINFVFERVLCVTALAVKFKIVGSGLVIRRIAEITQL